MIKDLRKAASKVNNAIQRQSNERGSRFANNYIIDLDRFSSDFTHYIDDCKITEDCDIAVAY